MDDALEEHYLRGYRKESRHERKLASANDRSKWKKTDQNKQKKPLVLKSSVVKVSRVEGCWVSRLRAFWFKFRIKPLLVNCAAY